jgi:hypothetical protein
MKLYWLKIVLLIFIAALNSKAQYNADFMNYEQTGRCVSVDLNIESGSNGMSKDMVNRLVWGGYISNEIKSQSATLLKATNNFGYMANYGMSAFIKGNAKFDYLIGFKSQEVANSLYTKDFFNLMFYGNQSYKGGTANLGNTSVNALKFQEAKFGIMMHNVDSVGKIGVSVSVLKGQQLFYFKTNENSSLYTSADGSELVLNSNFNMAISDTNNTGIGAWNGIGASADIFFETIYKSKWNQKCMLTVNVNNLGFINWWKNSVQYSSDSTFRYSGYTVKNINDLRDSTINRISQDSLLVDLANGRSENFNVNIPTSLILVNKVYFSEKYRLSAGFRHIYNANYKPYVFLEPELKHKNVCYTLHVGYGGYAKLNVGFSATWNTKAWFVKAGSNSLQGFVAPNASFSQGFFLSVAKKLK